jgi:hypothetical protein
MCCAPPPPSPKWRRLRRAAVDCRATCCHLPPPRDHPMPRWRWPYEKKRGTAQPKIATYLIPTSVAAKGVPLRLLRQRVVMTAQKAQADVLLHRLHYALPGWDAAAERRGAQGEFHRQRSPGKGLGW